jgi:hypothetical protein
MLHSHHHPRGQAACTEQRLTGPKNVKQEPASEIAT